MNRERVNRVDLNNEESSMLILFHYILDFLQMERRFRKFRESDRSQKHEFGSYPCLAAVVVKSCSLTQKFEGPNDLFNTNILSLFSANSVKQVGKTQLKPSHICRSVIESSIINSPESHCVYLKIPTIFDITEVGQLATKR